MNAITSELRTNPFTNSVSRRTTLRGLGAAGLATALAVGTAGRVSAHTGHATATARFAASSDDDPAAVIAAYIAAANSGDLDEILALYADDAFHIHLPSADGSPGVCVGKDQFRMWYEQSLANGERVALEDGTLAVDGNQATFLVRITSEPWSKLGLEALDAHSEVVVIDGRIATHVVLLTPESVRQLRAARGTA
ncbi:MAG: nuclear transport factor 2 family protein [Chloroflexi bacterium]|nr:nuclear transport factor 2 family protein [Chloroflexota bacterium]